MIRGCTQPPRPAGAEARCLHAPLPDIAVDVVGERRRKRYEERAAERGTDDDGHEAALAACAPPASEEGAGVQKKKRPQVGVPRRNEHEPHVCQQCQSAPSPGRVFHGAKPGASQGCNAIASNPKAKKTRKGMSVNTVGPVP